jgi:hypothetical protein
VLRKSALLRLLHHEPFAPNAKDWKFASTGLLSGANGAQAGIVSQRDRRRFESDFPKLKLIRYQPHTPFRYWMSGGLKSWTLLVRLGAAVMGHGSTVQNSAVTRVAGFVARGYLKAICDTGNRFVAAADPYDAVVILGPSPVTRFVFKHLSECGPAHLSPASRIVATDIGSIGYYSNALVLDTHRLVWPPALQLKEWPDIVRAFSVDSLVVYATRDLVTAIRDSPWCDPTVLSLVLERELDRPHPGSRTLSICVVDAVLHLGRKAACMLAVACSCGPARSRWPMLRAVETVNSRPLASLHRAHNRQRLVTQTDAQAQEGFRLSHATP